jgi:hypothetical protein
MPAFFAAAPRFPQKRPKNAKKTQKMYQYSLTYFLSFYILFRMNTGLNMARAGRIPVLLMLSRPALFDRAAVKAPGLSGPPPPRCLKETSYSGFEPSKPTVLFSFLYFFYFFSLFLFKASPTRI